VYGICFVSSGCANPTLTLPALAMRANGYLIEQYERCEIWSGVRRTGVVCNCVYGVGRFV
jgi:hypothetical protein